jgi:hypothetical protein
MELSYKPPDLGMLPHNSMAWKNRIGPARGRGDIGRVASPQPRALQRHSTSLFFFIRPKPLKKGSTTNYAPLAFDM